MMRRIGLATRILARSGRTNETPSRQRKVGWATLTKIFRKNVEHRPGQPPGQDNLSEPFDQDDVRFGVLDSGKQKSTAIRRQAGTPEDEQTG
jgi:hypothetical protein